jgi:hypothetical protein
MPIVRTTVQRWLRTTVVGGLVAALSATTLAAADAASVASTLTKPRAIAKVRPVLTRNTAACGLVVVRLSARARGKRWRVDVFVSGSIRGTGSWTVSATRATPANGLARRIAAGCPAAPASPPPPPPPPPPPGPGANAGYTFGVGVTEQQRAGLRDALDLGARYIRAATGRELPAFTVWASTSFEEIASMYAATAPTEPANAHRIWVERQTFAVGALRKSWFGPLWFATFGQSRLNATKIAVHEAFHVFQNELAGPTFSGSDDDIPRAGPRWLAEGSAELVGYLAIADAGLTTMSGIRADWAGRAASSPVPLSRLAILRGQFEAGANAWGIMPLAVERLVGEGGLGKVLAYFETIGRGVAWQDAFATTFGKSVDAFYAEFEAGRR